MLIHSQMCSIHLSQQMILSQYSGWLYKHSCNIVSSKQHMPVYPLKTVSLQQKKNALISVYKWWYRCVQSAGIKKILTHQKKRRVWLFQFSLMQAEDISWAVTMVPWSQLHYSGTSVCPKVKCSITIGHPLVYSPLSCIRWNPQLFKALFTKVLCIDVHTLHLRSPSTLPWSRLGPHSPETGFRIWPNDLALLHSCYSAGPMQATCIGQSRGVGGGRLHGAALL